MPTNRERRLALNEAAFRVANERKRNWPERRSDEAPARFYCECANIVCREHVLLRGTEYEAVRAHPHRFVIIPGHERPEIERVLARTDRFAVIEKLPPAHPIAEATDPRRNA